ncbi:MAG: hypothetical protein AAGJ40_09600 [Planctomycetota bacterium]
MNDSDWQIVNCVVAVLFFFFGYCLGDLFSDRSWEERLVNSGIAVRETSPITGETNLVLAKPVNPKENTDG